MSETTNEEAVPQDATDKAQNNSDPQPTRAEHAANLKTAQKRSLKNSVKKAKKAITDTLDVGSLLKQINPFVDWLFGIALSLAILKDILDIPDTALIAAGGIGELMTIIFTFFISIVIFLILVITGSVGKTKMAKNLVKKVLAIISVGIAESIPAIGLLPMETILIIVTFGMTLRERKKGAEESK